MELIRPNLTGADSQGIKLSVEGGRFSLQNRTSADSGMIARVDIVPNVVESNAALRHIEEEAKRRDGIILEGPPIYLWPTPGYHAEHMDSPAFINGWVLADEVVQRLQHRSPLNFVLIDDFNNRPDDDGQIDTDRQYHANLRVVPALRDLELLRGSDRNITFLESQFVGTVPRDECQFLDAAFQKAKLRHLFRSAQTTQEAGEMLRTSLLLVVHPVEFKAQQVAMLGALLGAMKTDPVLSAIPRDERRDLLSGAYRHLWLTQSGRIESITQPKWNGQKFLHKQIQV